MGPDLAGAKIRLPLKTVTFICIIHLFHLEIALSL